MSYGMTVPDGSAGQINAAVARLKKIANDADRHAKAVRGEASGMHQTSWPDQNGSRMWGEANALAGVVDSRGGDINQGANALKAYATKLKHVQHEVKGLIAKAKAADAQASTDAARDTHHHAGNAQGSDYSEMKSALHKAYLDEALKPLHAKYRELKSELKKEAHSAHGKLSTAVPGSKKGMSASEARRAARVSAAVKMPLQAAAEGQRLAGEVRKYVHAGKKLPESLLQQLEIGKKSAYFGTAFLEKLGPRDLDRVVIGMQHGADDRSTLLYNQRFLGALGDMLAHGTDEHSPSKLSRTFVDTLLDPLDQHDQTGANAAWRLSQLLAASDARFGRGFLDRVGDQFYALETSDAAKRGDYAFVNSWHGAVLPMDGTESDPTVGLFHALGNNAPASQDFFLEDKRLHYYIVSRPEHYYADAGTALGDALKAATTELRDGTAGEHSAKLTNQLINAIGEASDLKDGKGSESDKSNSNWLADRNLVQLKPALGDIVTSYIHSVNGSLGDASSFEGYHNLDVNFDDDNLTRTLRTIFRNNSQHDETGDEVYAQVLRAAQRDVAATMYGQLGSAESYGEAEQDADKILSAAGRSFGTIFNAHAVAGADAGEGTDDTNRRIKKVISEVENTAFGFGSGKAVKVAEPVVGDVASWAGGKGAGIGAGIGFNQLNDLIWPTDHEAKAVAAADKSIDPTTAALQRKLDPEAVNRHLAKLYREGHEPGVEFDKNLNWRHLRTEFGNAARKNGISDEP